VLTATREADNRRVLARDFEKAHGPFRCPECGSRVVLHKGTVVIHHFAHKPPVSCRYGVGESEEHRLCKQAIHDRLLEYQNVAPRLEEKMGSVRPDVFFTCQGTPVAIEVQISHLTMREIVERTEEYYRLGVNVSFARIPRMADMANA
jgi:competence protein CoiA